MVEENIETVFGRNRILIFINLNQKRFCLRIRLYKNRSFNAEILEADYQAKSFLIKINKNQYTVSAKDRFDILLDQLGMSNANASKVNDLKAPMPGLIVDIKVQVGDVVKKGDIILILEAMKMENVLKSAGDGTVKAIKVTPKQNVEKNQVLIEFEWKGEW